MVGGFIASSNEILVVAMLNILRRINRIGVLNTYPAMCTCHVDTKNSSLFYAVAYKK